LRGFEDSYLLTLVVFVKLRVDSRFIARLCFSHKPRSLAELRRLILSFSFINHPTEQALFGDLRPSASSKFQTLDSLLFSCSVCFQVSTPPFFESLLNTCLGIAQSISRKPCDDELLHPDAKCVLGTTKTNVGFL